MTKRVIILCEDKFGLEVYSILNEANAYVSRNCLACDTYDVVAFLALKAQPFGSLNVGIPIVGLDEWKNLGDVEIVMGLKSPERKEAAFSLVGAEPGDYATIVTPWTVVGEGASIGHGSFIASYSFKERSEFGSFVTLLGVMSETVKVGDFTTIGYFANTTNSVVGERVYVGTHSFLMEHIEVGDGSYVYPGSIVFANVKPGACVAGLPASGVKYRLLARSGPAATLGAERMRP